MIVINYLYAPSTEESYYEDSDEDPDPNECSVTTETVSSQGSSNTVRSAQEIELTQI